MKIIFFKCTPGKLSDFLRYTLAKFRPCTKILYLWFYIVALLIDLLACANLYHVVVELETAYYYTLTLSLL